MSMKNLMFDSRGNVLRQGICAGTSYDHHRKVMFHHGVWSFRLHRGVRLVRKAADARKQDNFK